MFRKKYKIKKRKKLISPYLIFSIIAVCITFVSYSYALLSDTLTIRGLITFLSSDPDDIEYGNSTYVYENRSKWQNTAGYPIYDVYVCITNLDQDFSGEEVTIEFDTNSGVDVTQSSNNCNIWQAASITQNGNRITLVLSEVASYIPIGNKIDLYFQLPFTGNYSAINITNLTLNGKYVRCLNTDSEDIPDTNTTTNSSTDNTIVANNTIENTPVANNTIENNTVANNTIENNTVANNTIENTTPGPDEPEPDLEDTTYNYSISSHWGTTYAIELPIKYYGENLDTWTISMTIPDGLIVNSSVFYQCSSISLSGNTLTLTPHDWSAKLESGKTLSLSGQLTFETEVDFFINNVTINGKTIPYSP